MWSVKSSEFTRNDRCIQAYIFADLNVLYTLKLTEHIIQSVSQLLVRLIGSQGLLFQGNEVGLETSL